MDKEYLRASDGSGEAVRSSLTQIRNPNSTTFTVDSVVGWPTKFVATSGEVMANGTIDPATMQVFTGHLSGQQIEIDTFAPGYQDLGNSVGDVVVLKPNTLWADTLTDWLGVSHNDDGTLSATAITQVATGLNGSSIRLKPRLRVQTTIGTLAPNVDNYNYERLTAQAGGLTISNPAGTPNDGDGLLIEITDNGTSRSLSWGGDYAVNSIYGLTLPTATVAGKTHFITFAYSNAKAKWIAIL